MPPLRDLCWNSRSTLALILCLMGEECNPTRYYPNRPHNPLFLLRCHPQSSYTCSALKCNALRLPKTYQSRPCKAYTGRGLKCDTLSLWEECLTSNRARCRIPATCPMRNAVKRFCSHSRSACDENEVVHFGNLVPGRCALAARLLTGAKQARVGSEIRCQYPHRACDRNRRASVVCRPCVFAISRQRLLVGQ